MNNLILDSEATVRLGLFLLAFLVLAIAELIWPRRASANGKWQRWLCNISISALNTILIRMLIPVAGVTGALLAEQNGIGLFNVLEVPIWLELFLFVLIFDLTIYWQHRIYHMVPLLWRFHRVHHTDQGFDLTTGNRFHPVSILISALIKLTLVFAFGASAFAILLAEVLLNLSSMFNHSNLKLPTGFDKWLRRVVVTPDMHRVHHSVDATEHNKNFGFNFSFWDRLFNSYMAQPALPHDSMTIGIDEYKGHQTRQLHSLLIQPLK